MASIEEIPDGVGGCFVLDVHPRRTGISHVNERGVKRSIGAMYGTVSRQLAIVTVGALVERLRGFRDRGRWLEG